MTTFEFIPLEIYEKANSYRGVAKRVQIVDDNGLFVFPLLVYTV